MLAHPLPDSLCARLAGHALEAARRAGYDATLRDLHAEGFDPRMTAAERRGYGGAQAGSDVRSEARSKAGAGTQPGTPAPAATGNKAATDAQAMARTGTETETGTETGTQITAAPGIAPLRQELAAADLLVLVFPTWWAGFPALLKGWFDRIWAPGTAFHHGPGPGGMVAGLTRLSTLIAITPLGMPGWIDRLVLWRPQRRALRLGILRATAPRARLRWLTLHEAQTLAPTRLSRFERRITAEIARARSRSAPGTGD